MQRTEITGAAQAFPRCNAKPSGKLRINDGSDECLR